ncbi:MAG: DNA-directed RNA polymerase subunit omega [Lachnospiraceae bacterium]|nr:DNA-directed RNA polymerase subunit omega [Lachnospiraceae bacterium]MBO7630785.1 DNA-directed RNA polymerase subunit omega [Lachnospiraceae bacterium]
MIHPSYNDLMKVVNSNVEEGEEPLVNSRYSIVLATAKRARQIIKGSKPLVDPKCPKPLSIAVQEVYEGKVKILPDEEIGEEERSVFENYTSNYPEISELGDGDSDLDSDEEDADLDDEDREDDEEKDEE